MEFPHPWGTVVRSSAPKVVAVKENAVRGLNDFTTEIQPAHKVVSTHWRVENTFLTAETLVISIYVIQITKSSKFSMLGALTVP